MLNQPEMEKAKNVGDSISAEEDSVLDISTYLQYNFACQNF
jgi:hypothetical protein